jgi:hypothetical protein
VGGEYRPWAALWASRMTVDSSLRRNAPARREMHGNGGSMRAEIAMLSKRERLVQAQHALEADLP